MLELVAEDEIVLVSAGNANRVEVLPELLELGVRLDLDAIVGRTRCALAVGVERDVHLGILWHPLGVVGASHGGRHTE